jgi:alginate O-acetyltransferase complex protein AlgI
MFFNSIQFAIFLPIVFILYWFVTNKSLKFQNILLLVSSYYFYACWDWRFLFLLVFSTFLDYYTGLKMFDAKTKDRKRFWFWLSVIVNLGFLGVFKYYNFFADSFAQAITGLGFQVNPWTLSVILPVGISFYTFHGLSYVIDIYKNRISPERNFIDYGVFVSFFPLLVAGPIERATHLLPQIKTKRNFDYLKATDGLRQILWGLFKKIAVADQFAEPIKLIFDNHGTLSGSTLVIGAIMFAFQIYCDFSGYSDIAIGTAKLLGIDLLRNFSYPYFSRDIAEFWRRWHISLSTWFRDYLYIPLGGSKNGTWSKIRNTFIIFLVSGFWHGANWTFIAWGTLNAIYIMPSIILNTNRNNLDSVAKGKYLPSLREVFSMGITFIFVVLAWIFFRSQSISSALEYIVRIFSRSFLPLPQFGLWRVAFLISFLVIFEWFNRGEEHGLAITGRRWHPIYRKLLYIVILFLIFLFGGGQQRFIYFQF